MKFFDKPLVKTIISHLSDVEGDLEYFKNWVKRSKYITFNQDSLSFAPVKTQQKFIFGGDFCDKGPGDLRIGRMLNDFKIAHPDKVTLLAGNREIKFLRLTDELHSDIRQRLLNGPAAFWNEKVKPLNYLLKHMLVEKKAPSCFHDIESYVEKMSELECQTIYLKWMLFETMGCGSFQNLPNTFEHRRSELAATSGVTAESISDGAVTSSFIESVAPDGVVTQYLKHAQLGEIVGDTLFIHGAITSSGIGYVPGIHDTNLNRCEDAREWIESLNYWYKDQINTWIQNPTVTSILPPGHRALEQYILFNPKSLVTTNWYIEGKLAPISENVIKFLNKAGIYRVVSGHQPFADFPLVIRDPRLEVIVGDTSYSDTSAANNTRGQAIHNLEIFQHNNYSYSSIDAVFKDGSSKTISLLPHKTKANHTIGTFTTNNQLIRPISATKLGASSLKGFQVIDENYDTAEENKPNKPQP
ncbi:MAG: metallophosphoesterase [Legionella sp.]|jgi:hypothetical protein